MTDPRADDDAAALGLTESLSQPRADDDAAAARPIESQSPLRAEPQGGAEAVEVVSEASVSVRRAPRYQRFLVLGAGLGAVVTFILTNLYPTDETVGFGPLLGFMLLIGVPAGAALGGIIAIILDAIATRRAKQYRAEHTTVDAPTQSVVGDLEG